MNFFFCEFYRFKLMAVQFTLQKRIDFFFFLQNTNLETILSMPQVDNTIFLSVIFSLVNSCAIFYTFLLVYVFYPFISRIKILYNVFSKIRQVKIILNNIF